MDTIVKDKLGPSSPAKILSKLDNEFSLFDFIKQFSKQYEEEYIEMLFVYKGKGGFKTVHKLISVYLSTNKDILNIEKSERIDTQNIFGEVVSVRFWKKK